MWKHRQLDEVSQVLTLGGAGGSPASGAYGPTHGFVFALENAWDEDDDDVADDEEDDEEEFFPDDEDEADDFEDEEDEEDEEEDEDE